jgi:hypothetical protein
MKENIVRVCWGKERTVAHMQWWRSRVLIHHIACFRFMFMRPHLLLRDSVWACPLLCVLSFAFTACDTFCCSCCSPRPNFLPFENVTQYALVKSVSQWANLSTLRFFDFDHSSTLLWSTEFWALTTGEWGEAKENTEDNEGGEGFVSALPDPAHNSMVVL